MYAFFPIVSMSCTLITLKSYQLLLPHRTKTHNFVGHFNINISVENCFFLNFIISSEEFHASNYIISVFFCTCDRGACSKMMY